ncbi:MAG: GPR endopeptidase [Clostridia bacterium]|nr:GPR endopeptidase [Clostridia bacterium]
MFSRRTDLALEARELFFETGAVLDEIKGVKAEEETSDAGIRVTAVEVLDKEGEEALGKEKGKYITIELPKGWTGEQLVYEDACNACAKEIKKLIKGYSLDNVLVVGLGNRNITPDAVGPKTLDSVLVTRHLIRYMPEEIDSRLKKVCAIVPGVLGITGIETGEIIKGLADEVRPSLIIAIDALCSRSVYRVNNTIQLSNTGITPGAGVGNRRMALNKKELGVPVIAVGVPTVIDAATIAADAVDLLIRNMRESAGGNSGLLKILKDAEQEDRFLLLKEVLGENIGDFIVTPKDIDEQAEELSRIIANGINIALHEGITLRDIDRYR